MNCPKCGTKLSDELFDPDGDWDYCGKCDHCHTHITLQMMKQYMEPSDCLLVRDGEINEDEFEADYSCQDCHAACTLALKEYTEDDMDIENENGYIENDGIEDEFIKRLRQKNDSNIQESEESFKCLYCNQIQSIASLKDPIHQLYACNDCWDDPILNFNKTNSTISYICNSCGRRISFDPGESMQDSTICPVCGGKTRKGKYNPRTMEWR